MRFISEKEAFPRPVLLGMERNEPVFQILNIKSGLLRERNTPCYMKLQDLGYSKYFLSLIIHFLFFQVFHEHHAKVNLRLRREITEHASFSKFS